MKPRYFLSSCLMAIICAICMPAPGPGSASQQNHGEAPGRILAKQAVRNSSRWTTTSHLKASALNRNFTCGEQITQACLSCHSEAAIQFHKSIHWTWLASGTADDMKYGKAGYSVNNFCISGNNMQDKGCLKCHTSWNRKGVKGKVNCLKCHNSSGFNFTEAFEDINAFSEDNDPDSEKIIKDIQKEIILAAAKVTLPTRKNCGSCHFRGGGGDGVKHGDLDTSLTNPNRMLDVHMGTDGKNFRCTRCHTTVNHHIAGRIYTNPAVAKRKSLIEDDLAPKITCVSCHSAKPHKYSSKMNYHTDRVACQTCHIPEFARINPTKMWWDWSKAGRLKNGKPFHIEGPYGKYIYKSIKGEFRWKKNVVPEYFWFNGSLKSITANDTIDPAELVKISWPVGSKNDPDSRIFPFKIHRGRQPYDKINKRLVAPMLSGKHGYWTTFDMNEAIKYGNRAIGIPYSGEFDYVSTGYAFPITHMVAPKEKALKCSQCHTRKNSRLASITGLYLPGRDRSDLMDNVGWISVIGALAGVFFHSLGRFFTRNGRNG